MVNTKKIILFLIAVILVVFLIQESKTIKNNIPILTKSYKVGEKMDEFNGVTIYYNGGVNNVSGRRMTSDGYNLGLKYQCVEFVKRYYYQHLNHKMPDTYGHAKDFFIPAVKDGRKNTQRNLTQYTNPSKSLPKVNDLLVFKGNTFNKYGHVAIVSKVTDDEIEIIQQNTYSSRQRFDLVKTNQKWKIKSDDLIGWLRKE